MISITSGTRICLRNRLGLAGAGFLLLIFMGVAGALAPWIVPHDPYLVDLSIQFSPPSWTYPLGTDHLGRCILSRLLIGIRYSLGGALIVVICSVVSGTVMGAFFSLKGGWLDRAFIKCCDILLAFPTLVLAFALVGVLGSGFSNLLIAMIFSQWIYYARFVRGIVLSLRGSDFVQAAIVSGSNYLQILLKHILPNIVIPVSVLALLETGGVILDMTGLTFLGLGIQAPQAEWGMMINEGKDYVWRHPLLMMYPGLAILLSVIAFNQIGDRLRTLYDPKEKL